MTRDPLVIVATLSLAGLALFFLVEHAPKWLRALASSKPFDGIRTALAPIALPGWIKAVAFLAWSALLLTLLAGMFFVILTGLAKLPGITPETAPDLRWYLLTLTAITAALGAIIALPFTLRRTVQNERQTHTQEEGYVTQQINSAVANLAAQKEVNKLGRTTTVQRGPGETEYIYNFFEVDSAWGTHVDESNFDPDPENEVVVTHSPWENVTLTEPNIEVRIGAILALERLARQRAKIAVREKDPAIADNRTPDGILDHDAARDHVRIMEILCTYIRENAPAHRARPLELRPWPELADDATKDEIANHRQQCDKRREEWRSEFQNWKQDHSGPRSDTEAVLRVLGRRTDTQRLCEGRNTLEKKPRRSVEIHLPGWHGYRLDLRQTDLQLADLAHSPDRPMNLSYSRLAEAQMQGAVLWRAQIQGADLWRAQMREAVLWEAQMEGANLWGAQIQEARFWDAQMNEVQLAEVQMQGADFRRAQMQKANLHMSQMQRGYFWETQMHEANLELAQIQGADFESAQMQCAYFWETKMDTTTDLKLVSLSGAGFKSSTLCSRAINPKLLVESFGDASVIFEGNWPKDFVITQDGEKRANTNGKLAHWSSEDLDSDEFEKQWRAFRTKSDYEPEDSN